MGSIEQGGGYKPRPSQEQFDAGSKGGNTPGGEPSAQQPPNAPDTKPEAPNSSQSKPSSQDAHPRRGFVFVNPIRFHPPSTSDRSNQTDRAMGESQSSSSTEEIGSILADAFREAGGKCSQVNTPETLDSQSQPSSSKGVRLSRRARGGRTPKLPQDR